MSKKIKRRFKLHHYEIAPSNYYVSEENVLVHNKCNKPVDKNSLQYALTYKDEFMTDSGEIIKKMYIFGMEGKYG